MALAVRLFLLLLLAVALPARAAQAAPLQARRADWDGDMDYLDALLDGGLKPLEIAGGPPTWKNEDTGDSKSLEAAQLLDKMLSDLERRRDMDQKALQKAALPGGIDGSVPATDARRQEVPDSATEEVLGKSDTTAQNPQNTPRIVCPPDVHRFCMIGTVVTLFTVPLVLIGCYFGIRKLYENRQLLKLMLM